MRRVGQLGWHGVCGGLFLASLLVTNGVRAAQEDNFILNASLGVMYDDNLFRLPEQVSAVNGRGDTIFTPTATLGYQQSFSKQQVSLTATAFSPVISNMTRLITMVIACPPAG